jgi:hypothetical protein
VSHARRDRGSTSILIVILLGSVIGVLVYAADAAIGPHARELRRLGASDQAFALAESGVEAARAQLERGEPKAIVGARLGPGRIDVAVARDGAAFVVTATGTVDAAPLVRPGEKVMRRVRARVVKLASGAAVVVEQRER